MIYELLYYFKKDLGAYNTVFKYIKYWYISLYVVPCIITLLSLCCSYLLRNTFYSKFTFLPIIMSLLIIFIIVNHKTKKIVKRLYKIKPGKILWNGGDTLHKLYSIKKRKMVRHLKRENLDIFDFQKLAKTAQVESEVVKIKFPLIPSIFAALFISLWNNYFSWIFKYENIKSFTEATQIFSQATIFLILVIIVFFIMKFSMYSTFNDLINKDYYKLKSLSRMLQEISDDMKRDLKKQAK